MGDTFGAAREGDALLHSSLMADLVGGVLEVAAYAALTFVAVEGAAALLAVAATVGTVGAAVAAVSGTVCTATGLIVGMVAAGTKLGQMISSTCEDIGNALYPPTVQARIASGSPNTRINGKAAARAAGIVWDDQRLAAAQAAAKAEQLPDERSMVDVANEWLLTATIITNPAGMLMATASRVVSGQIVSDLETFAGEAKELVSQMWRPTVAVPTGADIRDLDVIRCEKHPDSFAAMKQDLSHDPTKAIVDGIESARMLGVGAVGFGLLSQAISAVGGTTQYLAEGVKSVTINSQPAARTGARSTCEATVASEPGPDHANVSSDVQIGGPLAVVREIRSGKSPVALMIGIALAFVGSGKMRAKIACFLWGTALSVGSSKLGTFLFNGRSANDAVAQPVNAATGAKYLAGDEDRDFVLQGRFPLIWQRMYNSRDARVDGMFGASWSVPLEVLVERTPGEVDSDCWTFVDETGRRLDMQAVRPGTGFRSPGESLSVRRSDAGHWVIESDDGVYRVFEPDPHRADTQRLSLLGDRNHNALLMRYDEGGRLSSVVDRAQTIKAFLHYEDADHPRRVTRIERRYGESHELSQSLAHYRYHETGDLAEVCDAAGQPIREFEYDSGRRMVMHRLPGGLRCHYRWADFDGPQGEEWRVVEHWTDGGDRYWLDYDLDARRLIVRDGIGRRSVREWDALYQITRYENELGKVTHFEWNDERQLLSMTDAQGGLWRWRYDEGGRVVSISDPLGRVEMTEWHPVWALPTKEIDAGGHVWQHVYDQRGNGIIQIDPLSRRTLIEHDDWGQPIRIEDARGGYRLTKWNDDGQLARHIDCSGSETSFFYDALGRLSGVTDAEGSRTRYDYDDFGRLSEITHPDSSRERFHFDKFGQLICGTDGLGQRTRYKRDTHGRVTERLNASGGLVCFEYDLYGRLTALINENAERYSFEYDACDQLIQQINLDGQRQQTDYDALGNVTAARWAAGSSSQIEHRFERDAAGRLIRRTSKEDVTDYVHDKLDNLVEVRRHCPRVSDENLELIAFTYDALGRVLTETSGQGALSYEYDELGNRISTTLPDGRKVNQLYYGSGHLHQINVNGETVSDLERDRMHREVLRTQGLLKTESLYDAGGRIARRQSYAEKLGVVPERIIDRRYEYDALSRLVIKQHSLQGQTTFGYDAIGRVEQCSNEGYHDTWQYDAAANLLEESARKGARGQVIRFNRVLSMRGRRYAYDTHGRLTQRETADGMQSYAYDAHHRLIEARVERAYMPQRRYAYEYDALGRRTAKYQVDADGQRHSKVQFLWDGMRMVQETRADGESVYVYSGDGSYEPLARLDLRRGESAERTLYYHTDVNGAPEEMTDASGEIVWRMQYQVWGNSVVETVVQEGVAQQNLRFQGQYLDRETGLHYNLFRYYDPGSGRFITPDPIELAGGLNLYQYAPNPIDWIDPWGLERCKVAKAENLKRAGLGKLNLASENFNSGRKKLEALGFVISKRTRTGRVVFENPTTGTEVFFDGTSGSLVRGQKPHWEILTKEGDRLTRSGAVVKFESSIMGGKHIPAKR